MQFLVDPARVSVTIGGWLFLAVLCIVLPLGALRQHKRMEAAALKVSRWRIYASGVTTHLMLLILVFAAARDSGIALLRPYHVEGWHVAFGAVALAPGLLLLLKRFRREDPVARERLLLIAPRTPGELTAFYGLSISAGVIEELAYRGMLFTLLATLLHSWWLAAIVASIAFGMVHLFQGWRSAGIAGLIALRDHIVVGVTGTLFVAMVVHALHDIISGTVIARRAREADVAAQAARSATLAVS